MNSLNTYRKYLNFNKLFDVFFLLILFLIVIFIFGAIYYYTESYVLLFLLSTIIYCIGIYICKLYEIKIVLPSIMFFIISALLFAFLLFSEESKYQQNSISEYVPIIAIVIGMGALIFVLYKYETPVAIYLRIKDVINGLNYGSKIKKINDESASYNTNTLYSNHLLFEREKLLFQLNEDYRERYFELDNLLKKSIDQQEKEKYELNDLEENLEKINLRLKEKLSGAQDYELHVQKNILKKRISDQKDNLIKINDEVTKNQNSLLELKNIFDKEKYYIKNAYNMRYRSYTEKLQDKLIKTNYQIEVIPFETLNLEEVK
mgnify:CR=1 FL=1